MWMLLHLHVNQNVYDDEYSKLIQMVWMFYKLRGHSLKISKLVCQGVSYLQGPVEFGKKSI